MDRLIAARTSALVSVTRFGGFLPFGQLLARLKVAKSSKTLLENEFDT